ncbi:MAG: hypothetical protein NWF06_00445 [Candidatus Bathyarchaeota archaeon]|nr:hypothetical protein [Candidatus Bathyarchaeum sp.]
MSEEMPIGLTLAEKIVGLVLIIIGAIVTIYSIDPPAGDISHFAGIFVIVGVAVTVTGIFLLITKGE